VKTLILACLLCLGCAGLTTEDQGAQEILVLDFEYFKYEKKVYLVVLFGTNETEECEYAAVVRCVYKNHEWVPGEDIVPIYCSTAQEMIDEVRGKKIKKINRGRIIKHAHPYLQRASYH
jgi:hypothetical protein